MLSEARIHELVTQARAGDEQARASLLQGIRDRIFRWALVVTRDSDDAEDVTQQVSLTVHRRLADFEERSSFSTWLYTIVRNTSLDAMRKATRRRQSPIEEAETATPIGGHLDNAIEQLENSTTAGIIRAFFADLPARQRELVELVDTEGYSAAEAARMLGIEADTARVHLMRGRRALRARMMEQHPERFA